MMVADIPENSSGLLTSADREAHDWVMRFAAGSATAADLAAFEQWSSRAPAHRDAFARACQLWDAIAPAHDLLQQQKNANSARRTPIGRRAFLGGALAASAAGIAYLTIQPPLGLWPSLSELAADYRTAPGEQRQIALAEGSSVELNTRTSIALTTPVDGVKRIELISGELAIAARPEARQAFEIIAAGGRVTGTNAAFNVRYDSNVVCTTCSMGTVEVTHGGRTSTLRTGEQIEYSSGGLGPVATVDPALVTAWKEGVLVFRATPLASAVAEINRYRSGRIIVTNATLGRRLFNARFKIANIDGVVTQIQQIFDASVTSLPGGIVLLS